MNILKFLKKKALLITVVVVVVLAIIYKKNTTPEGFKNEHLNRVRCEEKIKSGNGGTKVIGGKTFHRGSYTWDGSTCWAPCGYGKAMRQVDKCGSTNPGDKTGQTKRPKAMSEDVYVA